MLKNNSLVLLQEVFKTKQILIVSGFYEWNLQLSKSWSLYSVKKLI